MGKSQPNEREVEEYDLPSRQKKQPIQMPEEKKDLLTVHLRNVCEVMQCDEG